MKLLHRLRPLVSGMVVVALLMAVWAPALSQLLGSEAARALAEVCSTSPSGSRSLSGALGAKAAASNPAEPIAHLTAHCPYCALHLDHLAPAPTVHPLSLRMRLAEHLPVAFLASPRTLFAWLSAQPRAPPLGG